MEVIISTGLRTFGVFVKLRFAKFREVHKHTLCLHIKECETKFSVANLDIIAEVKIYT